MWTKPVVEVLTVPVIVLADIPSLSVTCDRGASPRCM